MNNLFADCRHFVEIYIDDIVIHSRTLQEHMQHLEMVLSRLRGEKLFIKKKRCFFRAA